MRNLVRTLVGAVVGAGVLTGAAWAQDEAAQAATRPAELAAGESLVRIVRLSEVVQSVQLDRQTGNGFEATLPNLPIVQGNRLQTKHGLAEVEFEDDSSLRITPDTQVEFVKLTRTSLGVTTNTLKLLRGTMYVSLEKTKGNEFTIEADGETMKLPPNSHVRVDVYPAGSELYVYHGKVEVTDTAGSREVGASHALTFGGQAQSLAVVTRDETPGLYDLWDQQAVKFHGFRASSGAPYAYGQADMSYYGNVSNLYGCGAVWRPYFAGASFDPFANGAWAYYPGAGYTFVSPYPWGWTPFHSGEWQNCGGRWGWQPNASWTGLTNHRILHPVKGPIGIHPIHPPTDVKLSLVAVGEGRLPTSHVAGSQFRFVADSAGLGVPRETFGKLTGYSAEVAAHGSAERTASIWSPTMDGSLAGSTTAKTGGPGTLVSRPVATGFAGSGFGERGAGSDVGGRGPVGESHGSPASGGAHVSAPAATSGGSSGGSSVSMGSSGSSAGASSSGGSHH